LQQIPKSKSQISKKFEISIIKFQTLAFTVWNFVGLVFGALLLFVIWDFVAKSFREAFTQNYFIVVTIHYPHPSYLRI
jgi:uncharacterized membrane protein